MIPEVMKDNENILKKMADQIKELSAEYTYSFSDPKDINIPKTYLTTLLGADVIQLATDGDESMQHLVNEQDIKESTIVSIFYEVEEGKTKLFVCSDPVISIDILPTVKQDDKETVIESNLSAI